MGAEALRAERRDQLQLGEAPVAVEVKVLPELVLLLIKEP
jgi:hypothetical protein